MKKQLLAAAGAAALVAGPLAGTATAEEHPEGPPPRHGHILLIDVEYEGGEPVGFRKCIELAGGNALPLNAHHSTVHQGNAGEALRKAGLMAVPTAPLTPWANCEEFVDMMFAAPPE